MEVPGGAGPSGVAAAAGDPRAARAVASANASASLRFGGSASLLVDANVSLGAPAAFASGSLSVGAGAGLGIGIGATAGAAFNGLRVGTSAGASASLPNAQALLPAAPMCAGTTGFAPGGMARGAGAGSLGTDVGAAADLQARIAFD